MIDAAPEMPKVDYRQARGAALVKSKAKAFRQIAGDVYFVPSATASSSGYVVDVAAGCCTCPDHEDRRLPCKHLWAIRYFRHELELPDGTTFVTEAIRISYPHPPRYHEARRHEKRYVRRLLSTLCDGIPTPSNDASALPKKRGRGRPPIGVGDSVCAAALYVYSGDSCERAMSDLDDAYDLGLLRRVPCHSSVLNTLGSEKLTPILRTLVEEAAKPLRGLETNFAIDGTGFTTNTTVTYRDAKYGGDAAAREKKAKLVAVRMHAMVGVKTNAIVSVDVSGTEGKGTGESPFYRTLLKRAWENGWQIRGSNVSADAAYISHENLAFTEDLAATPWIPPRSNMLGTGSAAMERLFHRFMADQETWLKNYHLRSNVESMNSAIKRTLGGSVRMERQRARFNEVLVKALCYNLARIVHAMFEFGVEDPKFWLPSVPRELLLPPESAEVEVAS